MKLQELIDVLMWHAERHGNDEVVIHLSDPSVGTVANCKIGSAYPGFDWEKGLVLIQPDKKLYTRTDQEAVDALRKQVDGLVWDNMNLKRAAKSRKPQQKP